MPRQTAGVDGLPRTCGLLAALNWALAFIRSVDGPDSLVDGPWGGRDVPNGIYGGTPLTSFECDAKIVDGFGRGPLLQLPAAALDAVIGDEYEKNKLVRGFEANRNARAVFAESRAPLPSSSNDGAGKRELLTVQGAVRGDDYSDFGSKSTWQVGIEFRPVEPILLRGTHATAFTPPTLYIPLLFRP